MTCPLKDVAELVGHNTMGTHMSRCDKCGVLEANHDRYANGAELERKRQWLRDAVFMIFELANPGASKEESSPSSTTKAPPQKALVEVRVLRETDDTGTRRLRVNTRLADSGSEKAPFHLAGNVLNFSSN